MRRRQVSWPHCVYVPHRVWSTSAGWGCSRSCLMDHTSPPLSTTRDLYAKPVMRSNTYGTNFSRWGMIYLSVLPMEICVVEMVQNITIYLLEAINQHLISSTSYRFDIIWLLASVSVLIVYNLCIWYLYSSLEVSEEVKQYLKTPSFDNWWVTIDHLKWSMMFVCVCLLCCFAAPVS